MLTTNIDSLIGKLLNGGFRFYPSEALAAADFLRAEKAAREVTLLVRINGEAVNLVIGIEPHNGFYSRIEPNHYNADLNKLACEHGL